MTEKILLNNTKKHPVSLYIHGRSLKRSNRTQPIDFLCWLSLCGNFFFSFFHCHYHSHRQRYLPSLVKETTHYYRKRRDVTLGRFRGTSSTLYRLRFSGRISVSIIYRDWKKGERFCKVTETCAKSFLCPTTVVYYTRNFETVVKRHQGRHHHYILSRHKWIKRRFQHTGTTVNNNKKKTAKRIFKYNLLFVVKVMNVPNQ